MNRCPGCGGVVGRDCFNPVECQQISISQQQYAVYDSYQALQTAQSLEAQVQELQQRVARLEEMLNEIVKP